ncbi:MAG: sigma 54-interacting transcriptional regulator [Calditrichia bacterium]
MGGEVNKFEATIIGKSPKIREVVEQARKSARSSSLTTLITGESGTGKELIARLIHNLSNFSHQPFIDINCAAIPESLLESELFGYEKGAFTGAYASKPGLFELANGGTIFLDEIGNTTSNFQAKLLKVTENKKFRRIGGVDEVTVSTRIIAATNIDLYEAVRMGKFRADLYYRLNIYEIRMPPLREREEDVILIARHFIDSLNQQYGRRVKGLAPSAVHIIKTYPWAGNVRQLKNAIERAVLMECGDWIEAEHLSLDLARLRTRRTSRREAESQKRRPGFNRFEIPPQGLSLEEVERDLILSALEKSRGNLSQAARLLKIQRGKLRYRLEKLGIGYREILDFKSPDSGNFDN